MKKFQNILVAFDLNKTLFFKTDSPLPIRHHSKVKNCFFYIRPHIKDLIEYLHLNHINYCFWSNMMAKNCVKYVQQLKGVGMNRHCGIFDQDFCDWATEKINASETTEPGQKIRSIKNLHKLAALFKIDVDNCILVDDSKQKNMQGCHLIHIDSFTGQQIDKQLLLVIDQLKKFRKARVNENDNLLPMLQYTEYKFQAELDNIVPPKINKPVEVKKTEPSEIQLLIEKDPQLKKFKEDLVAEKQRKKAIAKDIQLLEKSALQMAEQVKKKSQGKSIRKGDDLLIQVLTFAKKKKMTEKKLAELKENKKNSEQKIVLLKKLMRVKVKELCPNIEHQQQETKEQEPEGDQPRKQKNKKKKSQKAQGQKAKPAQINQTKQCQQQ